MHECLIDRVINRKKGHGYMLCILLPVILLIASYGKTLNSQSKESGSQLKSDRWYILQIGVNHAGIMCMTRSQFICDPL